MILKIFLECLVANFAYSLSQSPILIVVSYDAFRYDFFDTKSVPHMNRLRKLGTYSDYLVNVFPTKTFPNHHSIATGLYPDIHGVIGNSYFNKTTNTVVHINYEMFHFNDNVVPIWRRNEDAGEGRHSGVMMWPGGCYPYQGKKITHCQDYKHDFDWFKRIDMAIEWIKDPKKPANLVMLYFDEPDTDGHIYGINSDIVNNLITKLDNITLYLHQQIEKNNLGGKVTIVHLSDHGMLDVKPPNFINVTQYLTPDTYIYAGSTPILQFHPKKGFESEIYEKLKNASLLNHFSVFKKEEFLPRWHYDNPRSPPILVLADVGYGLDDLIISTKEKAENLTNNSTFGVHGYDYTVREMRPFFMARGPKIKVNHKVPPFNTVDLFNFFCEVLEIAPTKNNGSNIGDIFIGTGKYSLTTILTITEKGIH
ncbi:ectonucleotide pyrophosphatase/phosphodiesterase family member 5-like isoform X2 [Tribolium madens]|uniref:ectonucleotide pyrophosphatase/phosphodiesterase family member 5-like isoform X2 n=1 Tax=Tribolium madens TaxID=41895 RepID=UPI001CF744DB|nr:ectonucleotide pyrophosphatase/phosphodiesterase family member 5-like isoform X2 [Tribolium madens]